jgi:DNA-binding response OmpR family regulator
MDRSNSDEEIHLLVVDDLPLNRDLLSRQLSRHGYRVTQAGSGIEALKAIEAEKIDLLLLDIRMPDMDGVSVLKQLRKTHSALNLPIIMVTAEDTNQSTVEVLDAGANDYLTKPINVAIAIARIESQLSLVALAAIKDELIHFFSHDLKKPLAVMLDVAQVMHEKLHFKKT